ncbi:MAG: hypothetical protein CL940_06535 [Deltaproteobacteria bacterium]|nr:hypothetical protein [Deltaproteobacteria bacterium]
MGDFMLTKPSESSSPRREGARTLATRPLSLPKSALPDEERGFVVVRPGDTLVSLAYAHLGDGGRWREIWSLNRDFVPNPRTILPGQTLRLPETGEPAVSQAQRAPDPESPYRLYVVRSMDSLSWIAKRELGAGSRWREIWLLNRDQLPSPNLLSPGLTLRIPVDESPAVEAPSEAVGETGASEERGTTVPEVMSLDERRARDVRERWGSILERAASELSLPVDVCAALCMSEHRHEGFERDGELRVRFERKIFAGRTGKWIGNLHRDPSDERRALSEALVHDEQSAYASLAMGGAGLMGYRARQMGYESPRAMWEAMGESEATQIESLLRLLASSAGLAEAARAQGWIVLGRQVGLLLGSRAGRAIELERYARIFKRLASSES